MGESMREAFLMHFFCPRLLFGCPSPCNVEISGPAYHRTVSDYEGFACRLYYVAKYGLPRE